MEVIEQKYRDTPKGHKKYAKRLTEYIYHLISKGRILEAKHFHSLLNEEKPNHAVTIRLGYNLSIASFDLEGVSKFDNLLRGSKSSDVELVWFRLKYYISVNHLSECEEACKFLLSKTLSKEHLDTIIEACLNLKSYEIAAYFMKYLDKHSLTLNDRAVKQIKAIALQRLVESIGNVIYD